MILNKFKSLAKAKFSTKLVLILVAILIFVLCSLAIDYKFQLMQYEEIGIQFTDILWTNSTASLAAMGISFCFIFLCILITNFIIKRKLKRFFADENMKPVKLPNYSLAFIIAIIGALATKDFLYQNALVYLNAEMFNTSINADPIFGKNFGYYLFQRPFFIALSDYISGTLLVVIIYSIAYYVLAFGAIFNAIDIKSLKNHGVVTHNLINAALFFLFKIVTFGLASEGILYSQNGSFFGAGYTEVKIWLSVYTLAPFILTLVVILSFIYLLRSKYKKAAITILIFPAYWLLGAVIAGIVQLVWVLPNEVTKEKSFIGHNIGLTRFAYNLSDKLEVKDFDISDSLTPQLRERNKEILDNLVVNDYSSTLDAQNQFQSIRNPYRFKDTDVSIYNIDDRPTLVYIAAREIDEKSIDEKSYENLRYKYTHGYGVVMSTASKVNPEGYPDFLIKGVPILPNKGDPSIKRPEIYFGELTKEHIFVNVKDQKEIDYPEADSYKEFTYDGNAGIKLTPLNRILMSIKLADPRILLSASISSNSRVLINRDIVARAKLITPFLNIDDEDAYIVVNKDGRLIWVLDAYTESPYFPYSQTTVLERKKRINYIRNSVKILIDAYDGTIKFYVVDTQDPIVTTYRKIYPNLFEKGSIPEDIQQHIRYPKRLLKIQAEILERYHVSDEARFVSNKDLWEVTYNVQKGKEKDIEPNYLLTRPADTKKPELLSVIPFIAKGESNLTGLIAARPDVYNKLTLYRFPKTRLYYGPKQIDLNIDKEQEIAKTFNYWRQGGLSIKRGDTIIIPLEDDSERSLIYVKPIYVSNDSVSAAPQLKKIIVAYQGQVVMEDDLNKALDKLLTLEPSQDNLFPELSSDEDLTERLLKVYGEMKGYFSAGDWVNFGKKMQELDEIVETLNKRKNKENQ